MKEYQSIPRFNNIKVPNFPISTWNKEDGSNLRFEWNKKQGFYKYGTRTQLFDESHPLFSKSLPFFNKNIREPLSKVFTDKKYESTVVFAEFYGENSFAGVHNPNDEFKLCVFDINVYKKGILSPEVFYNMCKDIVPTPYYFGQILWNDEFVSKIRNNEIENITFEGVVGKWVKGNNIEMVKAKTQNWIDLVRSKFDDSKAKELINS